MEDNNIPQQEQKNIVNQVEDAIINEQNTLPYTPISKLSNLQTVVPLALAGETLSAQYKFKEEIENIDEYLVEKLQYSSRISLSMAFSAEQADAVGFAIYQFERGKGLILADMAGIGKGRVNAGVLRYAYVNNLLPVFITEKPNLFSAIYRDIKDIGGLSSNSDTVFLGNPLILNGFKTGGVEKTYDSKGKLVRRKKASETGIIDKITGEEVITAPTQQEIKAIISSGILPDKFDYILLTYSQLGGLKGSIKTNYLSKLFIDKGNQVILALDEVHNAAGANSDVGTSIQNLLSLSKGVLFSSATFSKRPDNMFLYALKTDIQDSPLKLKQLIKIIKRGGERLTENLASNLVLSQQMLRREKTFDNCNVLFEFMDISDKDILFKKYDSTIELYKEIESFFDSSQNPIFAKAKLSAIKRYVSDKKIDLAERRETGQRMKDWKIVNENKFYISLFTIGEIFRLQFNFIETLLFALKADFVIKQVFEQLSNQNLKNVSTENKEIFLSNRKPVVAVRNTLEGVYSSLGYQVGDILDKADFSVYILSIAKSAISGTIELKQIKREDDKSPKTIIKDNEFELLDSDFPDGGTAYKKLLQKISEIDLDIPLSPIDRIIDAIETTPRPAWDKKFNDYPFYKLGEVTGRKFRLVKLENGKFELTRNTKDKNKSLTFRKFNDGIFDVLLINESGSTGEDAHSGRFFRDRRPRAMIIHQVELDVNTEVQKRGRINRTGMVNFPTYIYAISRIPSEIRRLLMLTKKMRSLDANTTANQKQSSKLSQIKDSNDNPIEDIINKYGDIVLDEFISSNSKYDKYMPTEEQITLLNLSGGNVIEVFVRNLELATSSEQEIFYDTINSLYIDYIQKQKEDKTYDLETQIKDLRASIKNRGLIFDGTNTSPFNSAVYEEDDFILAEDKSLSKEKVDELIANMALGQDPEVFYNNFLKDFQSYYKSVQIIDAKESISVPDYSLATDEAERQILESEYQLKIRIKLTNLQEEHDEILELLKVFKPRKACLIPAILDECYETDIDGNPKVPRAKNKARFIGVKISQGAKDKYSPMNIELVFCQLSGTPKLTLKPTKKGRAILEWIKVYNDNGLNIVDIQNIDTWYIDPNQRTMMRILTGDVLSAYSIAIDRVETEKSPFTRKIEFLKFTTADESAIRFGVRIFHAFRHIDIDPLLLPVSYPLNSSALLSQYVNAKKYITVTNPEETFNIVLKSAFFNNFQINIFGGLSKGTKSKTPKYFNALYEEQDFETFLENDVSVSFSRKKFVRYSPIGKSKSTYLNILQIEYSFSKDNEEEKRIFLEKITLIFDYIYEKQPCFVTIQGNKGEEVIKDKKDTYKLLLEAETEVEKSGIYEYALSVNYESIIYKLNNFSKFEKYEKTDRGYGKVFLNTRADAIECSTFSLIPLEPTPKTMIQDTLSLFSDTQKINFSQELRKRVANNEDDLTLGMFIISQVYGKVLSAKNIYGYNADDFEFIGNLFKLYSQGKIEEIKVPEKKKNFEEEEREIRSINFDTAQDFLIELLSKTR